MTQSPTSIVLSAEMLKAALTVAGGVLIFVLGQNLLDCAGLSTSITGYRIASRDFFNFSTRPRNSVRRLFVEPVHEQRKTIGEIAYALHMYGNVGQVRKDRSARPFSC